MIQQTLQLVYDLFYRSGGTWPVLGDVQRALNHQGNGALDAVWIVQRIPATLLKPLSTGGYPGPFEKVILTAEGIERCAQGGEDIANLVIAVKWLARLAAQSCSGDYGDPCMRFTIQQLAGAVSLSPESDANSVTRLVEILLAEGWVQNDGGTWGRTRTGPLRALGSLRISWHRAILGLQENQKSHATSNGQRCRLARPPGEIRRWNFLRSDKDSTTIMAVCTVVLVLLAAATLIVMLL